MDVSTTPVRCRSWMHIYRPSILGASASPSPFRTSSVGTVHLCEQLWTGALLVEHLEFLTLSCFFRRSGLSLAILFSKISFYTDSRRLSLKPFSRVKEMPRLRRVPCRGSGNCQNRCDATCGMCLHKRAGQCGGVCFLWA
jgi:hypothetical protein